MSAVADQYKLKTKHFIALLVATLLWVYIIFRAFTIEITQDEAYSYFLVKTNYWKALVGTANTHWLNSVIMKLFLLLPGPDIVGKLRMLSILSWPVYCYSSYKLSGFLKSNWLGGLFFSLALLNPFLLFYFSLARGYAASCAFIMLSLWQAIKAIQKADFKISTWFTVFIFASFSVLANFSAFYFYVALIAVYILYVVLYKQAKLLTERAAHKLWFLIAALSIFTIAELLFIKYYTGDLEFGGTTNLINSIFDSLIHTGTYVNLAADSILWIGRMVFVLLLISIGITIYRNLKFSKPGISAFSLYLIVVILLMSCGFHLFFETPFLTERTALIVYPPLVVGFLFFIDNTYFSKSRNGYKTGISALLIIGFLFYNFFKSYSPYYFKEWPVQTNTKECLDYINQSGCTKAGLHFWHYAVFVNYYQKAYPERYNLDYSVIDRGEFLQANDSVKYSDLTCLILAPPDTSHAKISGAWEKVLHFKNSGSILYIKK